jgi:hypothetical protein
MLIATLQTRTRPGKTAALIEKGAGKVEARGQIHACAQACGRGVLEWNKIVAPGASVGATSGVAVD